MKESVLVSSIFLKRDILLLFCVSTWKKMESAECTVRGEMAWYAKEVPRKSCLDGVYMKAYYWYANSQPIIVCKIRPRGIPTEEVIIKWLIKSNYKMLNDFWYILIHCSVITSSLRFWNGCLPRTQHPSGKRGSSAGNGCPSLGALKMHIPACSRLTAGFSCAVVSVECTVGDFYGEWSEGSSRPYGREEWMHVVMRASDWLPGGPFSLKAYVGWADGEQALGALIIHGRWKQKPRCFGQMQTAITGPKLRDMVVFHTA